MKYHQYIKNQIKMIIYLHLTDTPQSFIDPLFYNEITNLTNIIKYVRYLEYQLTQFQDSINENRVCLNISVDSEKEKNDCDFSKMSFDFSTINNGDRTKKSNENKLKKKKYLLSQYSKDSLSYEENKNFAKEFMKPYTNFKADITIKIFNFMKDVDKFEKNKEIHINIAKKNNLSDFLFQISVIQNKIMKNTVSSNPTKEMVNNQKQLLCELTSNINKYSNEVNLYKDTHYNLSSYLDNNVVKNNKWKKDYCQRTILLNVDKLKSMLNDDVISYIKSFIKPSFLEKVRRDGINEKHFPFPKQRIYDLLNIMSVNQIHMLCKNNLALLYNLSEFSQETALNQITDTALFMNYYKIHESHDLFDTELLETHKKKKLIRNILEFSSSSGYIHYYEFKREIYILANSILSRRRNRRK